jgi:hypothetical protein
MRGKLASSSFMGAVASLDLDCAGARLVIERRRPASGELGGPGSEFPFALPPESLLLFDAASGERLRPAPGKGAGR